MMMWGAVVLSLALIAGAIWLVVWDIRDERRIILANLENKLSDEIGIKGE